MTFISLLALAAPASSVAAAGGNPPTGVHVDPNSPAAKQYAIPLASARGQAPGSSASGPLFGAGIKLHKKKPAAPAVVSTPPSTVTATTPAPTTPAPAPAKPVRHRRAAHHAAQRHRKPASSAATGAPSIGPLGPPPSSAASTPPPAGEVLHSSSDSGFVWMLGLAALVLVLGGAGSLLAARRPRRPGAGALPGASGTGSG